jgi:hypothetical protein
MCMNLASAKKKLHQFQKSRNKILYITAFAVILQTLHGGKVQHATIYYILQHLLYTNPLISTDSRSRFLSN